MQEIFSKNSRNKIQTLIVIFSCFFMLCQCNNKPRIHVIEKLYYPNDTLQYLSYYLGTDSFPVYFKEFYENGNIKAIGQYDSFGRGSGRCIEYYSNGIKKLDCDFIEGGCFRYKACMDSVYTFIANCQEDENTLCKLNVGDSIDTYTNTEIIFFPYADGIPYGTYRVYYTSNLFHGYKELYPVSDIDGGFIVKTTNKKDTMNILYMFPNEDFKIIFGETPRASFSLVVK